MTFAQKSSASPPAQPFAGSVGVKDRLNALTERIIGAAIAVHRELGPGMLESAYEACLMFELLDRGLKVGRQVPVAIVYRGQRLDCGYRIDLLVDDEVIVELRCVEKIHPVHAAHLLSQLRMSKRSVGLLINFNVRRLALEGVQRVVNGFPD
jgi:GxxExxY protein